MEQHEEKLRNILNRNAKIRNGKNSKSTKNKPKKGSNRVKPKNEDKTPIDESKLSIREMKNTDKYTLVKLVSDFRRDYYINIYKRTFRSWFTYCVTGILLAISLTFINSKMSGICLPPLIVTLFLLWKVNKYKRMSRNLNVNEMELLNLNETIYFKFKSNEHRRANQGVLLAFLKESKTIDEIDINDIDLSDLDTDFSDDENINTDKNKKLVGYLVYSKQKDELETVCVKELCVDKEYRRRKIATCFMRKACLNVFKPCGFRRVTFQLSNFNTEALQACCKHSSIVNKIYSWVAYNFIPGVYDERNVYAFNISQINSF